MREDEVRSAYDKRKMSWKSVLLVIVGIAVMFGLMAMPRYGEHVLEFYMMKYAIFFVILLAMAIVYAVLTIKERKKIEEGLMSESARMPFTKAVVFVVFVVGVILCGRCLVDAGLDYKQGAESYSLTNCSGHTHKAGRYNRTKYYIRGFEGTTAKQVVLRGVDTQVWTVIANNKTDIEVEYYPRTQCIKKLQVLEVHSIENDSNQVLSELKEQTEITESLTYGDVMIAPYKMTENAGGLDTGMRFIRIYYKGEIFSVTSADFEQIEDMTAEVSEDENLITLSITNKEGVVTEIPVERKASQQ